jgi:hypothetical protein
MSVGPMLATALLLIATSSAAMATEADSGGCPITFPQGGMYGNEALQAVLPEGGKFVFKPEGAGFVDRDGAFGIKFAWNRRRPGRLFVFGRRVDGPAAPARSYMSNTGEIGAQGTYLVFPAPGCWEITGRLGDAKLTFVLLVEKIGDGPSGRFDGPPPGWRQTS